MSVTLESAARLNALKSGIEAKTGETYSDLTGGVNALIAGFGSGGGSVITEEWQRPSDWPNLSSLGKPPTGTTYLTFDCRDYKKGIDIEFTLVSREIKNGQAIIKRGYVENGSFVAVETIPHQIKATVNLDLDGRDFVVYELTGAQKIGVAGENIRQIEAAPLLEIYGTADPDYTAWHGGNSYTGTFSAKTKSVKFYDAKITSALFDVSYPINNTLESINADEWVSGASFTKLNRFFAGFNCLKKINLTFDTSAVTTMSQMFWNDFALEEVDLTTFNTSNVTNMSQMFYACRNLKILDLKSFDTHSVNNFTGMFNNCYALYDVDFSGLDTSAVASNTTLVMFENCDNLTNLKVGKITVSFKFTNCNKLSHDSLINVIDALETTDSTRTLTIGSTNISKLSEAEIAVATEKGWTVV